MNDNDLQQLLRQADERFGAVSSGDAKGSTGNAAFVDGVRRRRYRQIRRRSTLGLLAVCLFAGGLSAWAMSGGFSSKTDQPLNAIASNRATQPTPVSGEVAQHVTSPGRRLSEDEIDRLQAEIAALDAEANRARQFVELYRAAEARRERLAVAEAAVSEPLLPPDVLAQLEIDRAAAITVISADSQANEFNRLDEAAESYRSVLQHFPDSRWASVARDRLAQVQHMN